MQEYICFACMSIQKVWKNKLQTIKFSPEWNKTEPQLMFLVFIYLYSFCLIEKMQIEYLKLKIKINIFKGKEDILKDNFILFQQIFIAHLVLYEFFRGVHHKRNCYTVRSQIFPHDLSLWYIFIFYWQNTLRIMQSYVYTWWQGLSHHIRHEGSKAWRC